MKLIGLLLLLVVVGLACGGPDEDAAVAVDDTTAAALVPGDRMFGYTLGDVFNESDSLGIEGERGIHHRVNGVEPFHLVMVRVGIIDRLISQVFGATAALDSHDECMALVSQVAVNMTETREFDEVFFREFDEVTDGGFLTTIYAQIDGGVNFPEVRGVPSRSYAGTELGVICNAQNQLAVSLSPSDGI